MIRVGVDAVELPRWQRVVRDSGIGPAALTQDELGRTTLEQAAAFAGKEAVVKCMGTSVMLHDLRHAATARSGEVHLTGSFAREAQRQGLTKCRYSWSRCGSTVIAVAAMTNEEWSCDDRRH